jgi:uncharacterized protein (TIGR02118 family)
MTTGFLFANQFASDKERIMFRVVIMYPKTEDSHFDMDYYLSHHIPRIREIFKDFGLVKIEVDDGIASAMPGQPVPFASVSFFTFTTLEGFQAGFMSDGAWIMGDVPNYSSEMPQIQMNRIVVDK